jgi:hypothetical protein
MNASSKDRDLCILYHEIGGYSVVNDNFRYIYYVEGTEEFYNTREDYNEWHKLAGDEKFRPIIDEMKRAAPREFRDKFWNRIEY